jgi:hypothetical protein
MAAAAKDEVSKVRDGIMDAFIVLQKERGFMEIPGYCIGV